MTSHDAPPHMTSHDEPPLMKSSRRTFTSPRMTSNAAPSSNTSRVAPHLRESVTSAVPSDVASDTMTSNVPPSHDAAATKTSDVSRPHATTFATRRTSNVSIPHDVRLAAAATWTSDVSRPHATTFSTRRTSNTELNGKPPTPSDLFVHTHQHRKNKTWVDGRSEHVYEKFKRRKTELTQEASSQGAPPPKEIDVWTEVAGIRKGHIYGLGSESSSYAGRRNYRGSGSTSTEWVQRHEFEELKKEREETRIERDEMRRERDELHDMVKQLMESINFQPKPYTRDQVHERDVADDNDNVADDNDTSNYNDDVANDHMSDMSGDVSNDGIELDQE
ncbi:hypothetical protein TSUD_190810 [Trifolium subterraneum]|uniref:Uncharacterized protein n=1 Tax=Trifolium subterraneum TaxID=3900 RepID=A0A2Z6NRD0_TRISU|nr:hypothetical protein TSUD_190810 [Trifolium subterraneum]